MTLNMTKKTSSKKHWRKKEQSATEMERSVVRLDGGGQESIVTERLESRDEDSEKTHNSQSDEGKSQKEGGKKGKKQQEKMSSRRNQVTKKAARQSQNCDGNQFSIDESKEKMKRKKNAKKKEFPREQSKKESSFKKAFDKVSILNHDVNKNFEEYQSEELVEDGLSNKYLFQGRIRMNKQYKYDAYVTVEGVHKDILIKGYFNRNRAIDGDVVVVEVLPKSQWTLGQKNTSGKELSTESESKMKANHTRLYKAQLLDILSLCADLKPMGKVVYIKKRSECLYTGFLRPITKLDKKSDELCKKDDFVYFIPTDEKLPACFYIPRGDVPFEFLKCPDEFSNLLVVCSFDSWKENHRNPRGKYVRRIGECGDIATETEALLVSTGILESHGEFECNAVDLMKKEQSPYYRGDSWCIPEHEVAKRLDLRLSHSIFSIDPTNARDLDDALHVKKLPSGHIEIGVHIADVSHFIQHDSPLDLIARKRATSVYLVQKVLPMLPRMLCEDLCSLNPNVDRLAFSVIWEMTTTGKLVLNPVDNKPVVWFGKTIIRSCCKLDYNTAQMIIDGTITKSDMSSWDESRHPINNADELKSNLMGRMIDDIHLFHSVASHRRHFRFQNGAISLHGVKLKFELDQMGNPVHVQQYSRQDSQFLIEEYMLIANELVARHLVSKLGQKAFLRCHQPPKQKAMKDLGQKMLKIFPKLPHFNVDTSLQLSQWIQSIPQTYSDPMIQEVVQLFLTTPMKQAEYFVYGANEKKRVADFDFDTGHYALNLPFYTHFTSPIRRYADIIVHRLLEATLGDDSDINKVRSDFLGSCSIDMLDGIAENCNKQKLCSKKAQEECDRIFFCVYLKDHPLDNVEGIVIGLGDYSFSVYFPSFGFDERIFLSKLGVTGMLHKNRQNEGQNTKDELIINVNDGKKSSLSLFYFKRLRFKLTLQEKFPLEIAYELLGAL